ncbi:hypothetical protein M8494_10175 [Serratia ureilytica]
MDISNSVDRRNEILALIQANGQVYVNELADKFGFAGNHSARSEQAGRLSPDQEDPRRRGQQPVQIRA